MCNDPGIAFLEECVEFLSPMGTISVPHYSPRAFISMGRGGD
jgi:hypothetical protein